MGVAAIELATGRQLFLTHPGTGEQDINPAFSPDGTQLAYTRSSTPLTGSVYLLALNLEAPEPVVGVPRLLPAAGTWNTEATWTSDGKELIFSSGHWPLTSLWRVLADGSASPQPLTGAGQGDMSVQSCR